MPYIKWFAKGYGKLNDPRRGYVLTFIISLAFIAIADFDIIANIISNCYMSSWALVNISCFHSAYVSSSSWRPKFKYFNKWISLLCGLLCFVLMFCFDWVSALCLLLLMSVIWFSIYCYKPGIDLYKFFSYFWSVIKHFRFSLIIRSELGTNNRLTAL